jgi:hypothetical protein
MSILYIIIFDKSYKIIEKLSFNLLFKINPFEKDKLINIEHGSNNLLSDEELYIDTIISSFPEQTINIIEEILIKYIDKYISISIDNNIYLPCLNHDSFEELLYPKNIKKYLENCIKLFNESFNILFKMYDFVENWEEIKINNYLDLCKINIQKIYTAKDLEINLLLMSNINVAEKIIILDNIEKTKKKELHDILNNIKILYE